MGKPVSGPERVAHNIRYSSQVLRERGISFDVDKECTHLVVQHGGRTFDFWPSTGIFRERNGEIKGRGVNKLLEVLQA